MKIAQVISYIYPAWSYGGPGKLVYEMAQSFESSGQNVIVATTDAFDATRRRNATDNPFLGTNTDLTVYRNISNYLAFHYKAFLTVSGFAYIEEIVSKADIVHIHEIFTPLMVGVLRACKKTRTPLFISAHGTLSPFHRKHRSIIKRIFFSLYNDDLHGGNRYIAATKEEVEEYIHFGISRSRISFVPNGIDVSPFLHLPPRGTFRKKYSIPDQAIMLLYIGRIHPLKGLDILIRACYLLQSETPIYVLIGGGDDGYLSELQRQILEKNLHSRMICTGILAGEDKRKAMADADIFVYPSPGEGFSLAILEAGAAGMPLVITEGCKFPEVKRAGAGCVVESSVEGLAGGIRSIIQKETMKRAGEAARRLVQKHYTVDRMCSSLISLYGEAIRSK